MFVQKELWESIRNNAEKIIIFFFNYSDCREHAYYSENSVNDKKSITLISFHQLPKIFATNFFSDFDLESENFIYVVGGRLT